jgi:hypothetical protein
MKYIDTETYSKLVSHIEFNMNDMIDAVERNVYPLDYVMSVALSQRQPQARFSCWVITKLLYRNSSAICPYISQAIAFLPHATHTGQTREILRWFTICKPTHDNDLGTLLDFCLSVLPNNTLPVAIKVHAMTIIENIAKKEPDIIPEFAAILEDIYMYQTVGGKNKIQKLLKKYESVLHN